MDLGGSWTGRPAESWFKIESGAARRAANSPVLCFFQAAQGSGMSPFPLVPILTNCHMWTDGKGGCGPDMLADIACFFKDRNRFAFLIWSLDI